VLKSVCDGRDKSFSASRSSSYEELRILDAAGELVTDSRH
jgi:hypothetical protein